MVKITSDDGKEFLSSFNPSTRKVYSAGLSAFLRFMHETGLGNVLSDFLDALEEDSQRERRERKRVARNALMNFVKYLEGNGYSSKSIRTYVSAVQSFAGYFDYTISTRRISLPSNQPVSKKHPWTIDEIGYFIVTMKDVQLCSIAATMFQSGISVIDALALTWGDIESEYTAGITPLCLDFTRIKTDIPFMTFIGNWGVARLRDYLDSQQITLKSKADPVYHMSKRMVEIKFRNLGLKQLGSFEGYNPMRPHSMRSAFRTLLGDAKMNETYIEFFMGHKLPEHKGVYLSKSREGWRQTYSEYEAALTPQNT